MNSDCTVLSRFCYDFRYFTSEIHSSCSIPWFKSKRDRRWQPHVVVSVQKITHVWIEKNQSKFLVLQKKRNENKNGLCNIHACFNWNGIKNSLEWIQPFRRITSQLSKEIWINTIHRLTINDLLLQYKWIHKKSFSAVPFWRQNYWVAFFWVHSMIIILVLNAFQWTWYRLHALWNRTIRINWMLDFSNCKHDTYRTLL